MSEAHGTGEYLKAFGGREFSPQDLEAYANLVGSRRPYILFFTPRSGSSYLVDLLTKTWRLGSPEEFINLECVPLAIKHISETGFEVKHIIDYLGWLMNNRSTRNGVFGLKVSYGCYRPLVLAGLDDVLFGKFTPIVLFRKNILKQAVSLYVAVSTGLFHTNIAHSQEVFDKVKSLPYDQRKIRFWVQHVAIQEAGIRNLIEKKGLDCLSLDYDQVCREPDAIVRGIAERLHVTLPEKSPDAPSIFQKVGTKTNDAIIEQFISDDSNLSFLETLGLDASRLAGA